VGAAFGDQPGLRALSPRRHEGHEGHEEKHNETRQETTKTTLKKNQKKNKKELWVRMTERLSPS
jgi:hypothetical protein